MDTLANYTSTPEYDRMSRLYNNIWGAATDTRMFKDASGDRVITGTLFSSEDRILSLLYNRMIAGTLVDCKQSTGCNNFSEWLDGLGYKMDIVKDPSHPLGIHAHVKPKTQLD